ncbi:hypothetical protein BSKO_11442 [Bryopsis sp. KO-2023]|nr:hypothetical protein BSKO_11442 [Bryopsis sp. KO-2023]
MWGARGRILLVSLAQDAEKHGLLLSDLRNLSSKPAPGEESCWSMETRELLGHQSFFPFFPSVGCLIHPASHQTSMQCVCYVSWDGSGSYMLCYRI